MGGHVVATLIPTNRGLKGYYEAGIVATVQFVATLIPTNRGLKGARRRTTCRRGAVATLIPTNRGLKVRVRKVEGTVTVLSQPSSRRIGD